ncbi:uncharacterized protein, partial [Mytilus edulis]|uniref:uncharacterized protein n=1 Tax=Mytilus edulis TaxID=6550 RepID=UPI0039F03155
SVQSNAYYIKQKLYCGCNFSSTVATVSSHVTRGATRTRKGPTVFSSSDLKFESNKLLTASISPNTSDTYETAVRSFDQFRSSHGHAIVWPPSLNVICNFIAYLSVRGYAPSTAKSYIFGIAFKCKMLNITDNTHNFIIKKRLIGMERLDKRVDSRLPITPQILDKLISLLPSVCLSQYETLLFSGLFSLAYFGFFRIGELVVNKSLAHSHTLSLDDFSFSDNNVSINLKFSKTDQLGKGSLIIIPSINSHVCPVHLLKKYFIARPKTIGPAFIHFGGHYVTRYQFNAVLKKALNVANITSDNFQSHSFRIGAASQSSKMGFSDDEIQDFGRWESKAYKTYIRIPTLKLASQI